LYLRSTACAVVGLIKQDVAVLVEHPRCLPPGVDDLEKFIEEPRCPECELPILFVDIEHAPLRSRVCRGFRFVDRRCNTVNVEDARKCQPAEAGTDDRDWSIHADSSVV
jgi:hypothetical protein